MSARQKRFAKAYIEITNVCNLNCSFCAGTKRKGGFMSLADFTLYAEKLAPYTDYVYLHIMGEPLLHPQLKEILKVCEGLGLKVCITTNGTLLPKTQDILLSSASLYKLCVSLHSFEANNNSFSPDEYIRTCALFCNTASKKGIISVLRMWNLQDGKAKDPNSLQFNNNAEKIILSAVGKDSVTETPRGVKLAEKLFIEYGEKFSWRQEEASERVRCYALRDQIGVLCDGTAVPCCIDCDGVLALGNLKHDSVEQILSCELAQTIYHGFLGGNAAANYCKKCGFVRAKFN